VIRSGREANYQVGKDTGLFWDAGASNVHWVIVNDEQVEDGIKEALSRVRSKGVLIEGNSLLDYVTPVLAVMCARSDGGKVKPSARRALLKSDVLYLSSLAADGFTTRNQFNDWQSSLRIDVDFNSLPIFTREDLPQLMSLIHQRDELERSLPPSFAITHSETSRCLDSTVKPSQRRTIG
jgi:hypothetical protein